jgi:hypothetical protein
MPIPRVRSPGGIGEGTTVEDPAEAVFGGPVPRAHLEMLIDLAWLTRGLAKRSSVIAYPG